MRKNKTVEYVIYPPGYEPGMGFKEAKTKLRAACIAAAMGVGAEVVKMERRTRRVTLEDGSKRRDTLYSTVDFWTFYPKKKRR